jgi:hypothetical protein
MKKLLHLIWYNIIKAIIVLSIAILSQCEKVNNSIIISDKNFTKALIYLGIDKDKNGSVSQSEAESAYTLVLTNWSISDLTGIEQFVNLDSLYCDSNNLSSIDLTKNIKLQFLNCNDNNLTTLNLKQNKSLEELICDNNKLVELDVSKNQVLWFLWCNNNQLEQLDLTQNLRLRKLHCESNRLSSLDISKNVLLEGLDFAYNNIESIDATHNTKIRDFFGIYNKLTNLTLSSGTSIYCNNNKLITLDVTKDIELMFLNCGNNEYEGYGDTNQITNLNMSNNVNLQYLGVNNMPSLTNVCVRETPFPPPKINLDSSGSPNISFSTDCQK